MSLNVITVLLNMGKWYPAPSLGIICSIFIYITNTVFLTISPAITIRVAPCTNMHLVNAIVCASEVVLAFNCLSLSIVL